MKELIWDLTDPKMREVPGEFYFDVLIESSVL
jgi:hypothetical protein